MSSSACPSLLRWKGWRTPTRCAWTRQEKYFAKINENKKKCGRKIPIGEEYFLKNFQIFCKIFIPGTRWWWGMARSPSSMSSACGWGSSSLSYFYHHCHHHYHHHCHQVRQGTIFALLGPSGCGKTTLLSCILGRKDVKAEANSLQWNDYQCQWSLTLWTTTTQTENFSLRKMGTSFEDFIWKRHCKTVVPVFYKPVIFSV